MPAKREARKSTPRKARTIKPKPKAEAKPKAKAKKKGLVQKVVKGVKDASKPKGNTLKSAYTSLGKLAKR